MDLRVVPIDNGQVTVMDRHNLDAGAIYMTPDGLSYDAAVRDARRWAERHNAENVVDKLTRVLAGETVEGLAIGSAGITRAFCQETLNTYRGMLERMDHLDRLRTDPEYAARCEAEGQAIMDLIPPNPLGVADDEDMDPSFWD